MKYLYMLNVCFLMFGCVYSLKINFSEEVYCNKNCSAQRKYNNLYELALVYQEKCGCNIMDAQLGIVETNTTFSAPELHCRAEDEFTVRWKPWHESFVYLLEIRKNNTKWIVMGKTTQLNFTFINLTAGEKYQVRLWGSGGSPNRIWGPRISHWMRTLDAASNLSNIANVTLSSLQLDDTGLFVAVAEWTPNQEDLACFYDILLLPEADGEMYRQIEIRMPPEKFAVAFNKLQFDSNYSVQIMAKSKDLELESDVIELCISTPTCLEEYDDLTTCAPPAPSNLSAFESLSTVVKKNNTYSTYYNITAFWDKPRLIPDYYELFLINYNFTRMNITVPGNATEAVFNHAEVRWVYQLILIAYSSGGSSPPTVIQRNVVITQLVTSFQYFWVVLTVTATTISMFTLLSGTFYFYHRRAKRQRYERRCKYFEELEEKAPKSIDCITNDAELILEDANTEFDKWELRSDMLVLQNELGEGAFGLVRRAWLRDEKGNANLEVAVKMLKDTPTSEQVKHFLHEIDIMKTVGSHPNLVSILGCCTRPQHGKNMMLVVEYCAFGDLQNYLLSVWNRMTCQPVASIQYADLISPTITEGSTNLIINKLYDLENETKTCVNLQPSDLLSFARQIATGMEFLTSLKVLHRDLAARNVLVCGNKSVKIADFGLSRDVYKENMYRKTSNGRLPIRWMAIESLTHQVYTAQSDVWSFGILLWEIVTLGGNPYPSVPNTNTLLKLLKGGYRMERPSNCGLELYTIMLSCWKVRPKDRPTFNELRKCLDALLESVTTAKYLDLDVLTSMEFASFRVSIKESTSISLKSRRHIDSLPSEKYINPTVITS